MVHEPHNGDHEHVFQEIYQSDVVGIAEEITHATITVELFERGLAIHMSREESLELARAFTALTRYLDD